MNILKFAFNSITGIFRKKRCHICGGPGEVKQDDDQYLCYDHVRDFSDPDYPEHLERELP
jgi:hypothetical protein